MTQPAQKERNNIFTQVEMENLVICEAGRCRGGGGAGRSSSDSELLSRLKVAASLRAEDRLRRVKGPGSESLTLTAVEEAALAEERPTAVGRRSPVTCSIFCFNKRKFSSLHRIRPAICTEKTGGLLKVTITIRLNHHLR